jgi:hypothetical protein
MGVNRYRISAGKARFDRVMRDSEDVVFHRCANDVCGYGSDTDRWDQEGRSDFVQREEACQ